MACFGVLWHCPDDGSGAGSDSYVVVGDETDVGALLSGLFGGCVADGAAPVQTRTPSTGRRRWFQQCCSV
jgi:hypothetical protein